MKPPTAGTSRRRFLQSTAVAAGAGLTSAPWLASGLVPWAASQTAQAAQPAQAAESRRAMLPFQKITCQGAYPGHLQGVCADGTGAIYWSWTTRMVRTDADGVVTHDVPADNHHGDLCHHDGKIYVAVNLGSFNQPAGRADSWVYVYEASSLKEIARHPVVEVVHGAGGMDWHNGRFYVVGGLPSDIEENYVYEYDADFRFVRRHVIASGQTLMGIQTALFHDGCWWFGCYGGPSQLLQTDPRFNLLSRWDFDAALGLVAVEPGKFLIGRNRRDGQQHTGWLLPAVASEESGLKLV